MKKVLVLILVLLFALIANAATYYPRTDNAQRYSTSGAVLVSSNAQVWVYNGGTTTLATLYSNSTGSVLANPVIADRYGNFSYYAAPGFYDESIVGPAGTNTVYRYGVSVGIRSYYSGGTLLLGDVTSTGTFTVPNIYSGGSTTVNSLSAVSMGTAFFTSRQVSLNATHAAASAVANSVIILDSATSLSSDLTTTVPLIPQGGTIDLNGHNLTVGPFQDPGPVQVFTGSGAVTFGAGSVKEVYPQWWGAKGDGSTDDTTAVQNAINSYSRVWIPKTASTYILTALTISKSNFTLTGNNAQLVLSGSHGIDIAGATGTTYLINANMVEDAFSVTLADTSPFAAKDIVVFRDPVNNEYEINEVGYIQDATHLWLTRPITYPFATANSCTIAKAAPAKSVEISNLDFSNSSGMAIYVTYGQGVKIEKNRFHDISSSAITDSISLNTTISENHFDNIGTGTAGPAIGSLMSRGGVYAHNDFKNQQHDECISLYKRCWETTVKSNDLTQQLNVGVGGAGIYLADRCSHNSIESNFISRMNGAGIDLTASIGNAKNRFNVISKNIIMSCNLSGINLTGAASSVNSGNIIRDNVLLANTRYGLEMDANSSYNSFYGNAFSNNVMGTFLNNQTSDNTDISTRNQIYKLQIGTAGSFITSYFSGTVTWDPPSLNDGLSSSATVTATGASLGDTVTAGFKMAVGGTVETGAWNISGRVTATDVVTVTITNHTGSTKDLDSNTLRVGVFKHN